MALVMVGETRTSLESGWRKPLEMCKNETRQNPLRGKTTFMVGGIERSNAAHKWRS